MIESEDDSLAQWQNVNPDLLTTDIKKMTEVTKKTKRSKRQLTCNLSEIEETNINGINILVKNKRLTRQKSLQNSLKSSNSKTKIGKRSR